MSKHINFWDLCRELYIWRIYNFPNAKPYQPLLGVAEEVGELCHAHLKQEQNIRNDHDFEDDKYDAVGDIIIYLADYCLQNDIDMQVAVESTLDKILRRDWIKYPINGIDK